MSMILLRLLVTTLTTLCSLPKSYFLSSLMKEAVHRPRPPAAGWLVHASGWAFPSGHTTQATAAWGILCVLACTGRSTKVRAALVSAAALIVLLVAASRYYLGVHWVTDVLAGISLGVAILALWGVARVTVQIRTTVPGTGERPARGSDP